MEETSEIDAIETFNQMQIAALRLLHASFQSVLRVYNSPVWPTNKLTKECLCYA